MEFKIDKVSTWYGQGQGIKPKPCDGAVRDGDNGWKINIPNLEALMHLIAVEGRLIIDSGTINIYDDYVN